MQTAHHRLRSSDDDFFDGDGDDYDAPPRGKKRGKARWWHKLLIVLGSLLIIVSGGGLIGVKLLKDHYEGMVAKEDILEGLPYVPPADDNGPRAKNFLVLGTDTRSAEEVTDMEEHGNRSDTIMIAHVDKQRKNAFIFSIPRDSYIDIPAAGKWNGGKNKVNAAMSFGGANLAAKTIYNLTKIPLDGAVIVNFQGIQNMVAAVGGVRVCIPYTVRSSFSDKVWQKGCHNLNPKDAEEFVRQRHGTPGGDLGRIKNQQHVIKGIVAKAKQGDTLTNPSKLNALITTAARSLTVDKNMNLTDLAIELRDIDQENIRFATAPVVGTFDTPAGNAVQLDDAACEQLFAAVREDRAEQWLSEHPQPEVASIN